MVTGDNNDHGHLYIYLGEGFGNVGGKMQWSYVIDISPEAVQGPTGRQGNEGIPGPVGPTGAGIQGIQGATGEKGEHGVTGPIGEGHTGSQGEMGATGPMGPTGIGPTGPMGKMFTIFNHYETLELLRTDESVNTTHIGEYGVVNQEGENHGRMYVYKGFNNGSFGTKYQWQFMTDISPQPIEGPTGVAGLQGSAGSIGPTGPAGQGIDGAIGPTGASGLAGPTGEGGVTGPAGADGKIFTIFETYTTLNALLGDLPSNDHINEFAVTSQEGDAHGRMYVFKGANQGTLGTHYCWDYVTDISPIGITGPAGQSGETGLVGQIGPTGIAGLVGSTGPPGLMGATGLQGVPGEVGPTGLPGQSGIDGSIGATGPAGKVFKIFKYYTSVTEMQEDVNISDTHLLEHGIVTQDGADHGRMYVYLGAGNGNFGNDFQWEFVTDISPEPISGPTGNVGPAGPTGQGPTGEAGPMGSTGPVGVTGASGIQGPTGLSGNTTIGYMTDAIYNEPSDIYYDKLFAAYMNINNTGYNTYYMSKHKKIGENVYEWYYTPMSSMSNSSVLIGDDWTTSLQPKPTVTYSNISATEGQVLDISPVVTNSPNQFSMLDAEGNSAISSILSNLNIVFNTSTGGLTTESNGIKQGSEGSYNYYVYANNSGGQSIIPANIVITVSDDYPTPVITYPQNTYSYTHTSQSQIIQPTVNTTCSWTISPNNIQGVAFNTSNGEITVTPSINNLLTSTQFVITATNQDTPAESSSPVNITIEITKAIPNVTGWTPTSVVESQTNVLILPQGTDIDGTNNVPITFNIFDFSTSTNPIQLTSLGLTFHSQNDNGNIAGSITGTVLQGTQGTYDYIIRSYNDDYPGQYNYMQHNFTLTINDDNIEDPNISYNIASTTILDIDVPFTALANSGSNDTITWDITPSTLPTGLTFDGNGNITGTPTSLAGEAIYTITATNTVGETDSFDLTLSVIQPLPAPIIVSYPPIGGSSYNLQEGFTIPTLIPGMSGGEAASFQILDGKNLSEIGLSFDTSNGYITGTISQGIGQSASYDFRIQATNETGNSNILVLSFVITDDAPHPTFNYGNNNSFALNTISGNQSYTSNANVNGQWTMIVKNDSGASLPNQITFNTGTGEISVNPSQSLTSTEFTVSLTNTDNETTELTVTFEIIEAIPNITSYKNNNTNAIISNGDTITIDEGENLNLSPENITNMPSNSSQYNLQNSSTLTNTGIIVNATTGIVSATSISNDSQGSYSIVIKPNNGSSDGSNFTINVTINDDYPNPNISTTDSGIFTSGDSVSITFNNSGGAISAWNITPSLPGGLTFSNGVITGTAGGDYNTQHTITAANVESEISQTTITLIISSATAAYSGVSSLTYLPSDYATGNYNAGSLYYTRNTDQTENFVVSIGNNQWLRAPCPKFSESPLNNTQTTNLTYVTTLSSVVPYLPSDYASHYNSNTIQVGSINLFTNTGGDMYMAAKVPNSDWNPSNVYGGVDYNQTQGYDKYIYKFIKTTFVINNTDVYDNLSLPINSDVIPEIPNGYASKTDIENGQMFIGKKGTTTYLIVHYNSDFYRIDLSEASFGTPNSTYDSDAYWVWNATIGS